MLRVSNPVSGTDSSNTFFSLDKRKKQVNLVDPAVCGGSAAPEDRRVGVAAPKMFAFDAIFSQDDSQVRKNMGFYHISSACLGEMLQVFFSVSCVLKLSPLGI